MKIHCLKVEPKHFEDLLLGNKTCEIRYNDRDYQVGDDIVLQAWGLHGWSEDVRLAFRVTHITTFGMAEGFVALSIKRIPVMSQHNDAFGKHLIALATNTGEEPLDTLEEELNSMTLTHYVLKRADVARLSPEDLERFHEILGKIGDIRIQMGKEPTPRYLVLNHDEEWIQDAIGFMKKIGAWGGKE